MSKLNFLTALPVFNEFRSVNKVLDQVRSFADHVLVVDDGSTDGTSDLLRQRSDIIVKTHEKNQGYGAALMTAFSYAIDANYDFIITIDCDGQHEPQRIPSFVSICENTNADIISGSRYLQEFNGDTLAPEQRQRVNQLITAELNERLGLQITDAFCGFKAYRVSKLSKFRLTETGYAMPLELWVQAAHHKLKIVEYAIPRIYLDNTRSFGGQLDDMQTRLDYYHLVINRSLEAVALNCVSCQAEANKENVQ